MLATWRRFGPPRRAPGRFQALFLACRGALWNPPGAPGASLGCHEMLQRRSRDASGTLLGSMGCPERVPGSIFIRFPVPRTFPRVDLHSIFAPIFASLLQASWPANGMPLETRLVTRHSATHELPNIPDIFLEFSRRMLGGCSDFARDSDAGRILQLDSPGSSNLERHAKDTFLFTGWTSHDGFRFRAICTMEL